MFPMFPMLPMPPPLLITVCFGPQASTGRASGCPCQASPTSAYTSYLSSGRMCVRPSPRLPYPPLPSLTLSYPPLPSLTRMAARARGPRVARTHRVSCSGLVPAACVSHACLIRVSCLSHMCLILVSDVSQTCLRYASHVSQAMHGTTPMATPMAALRTHAVLQWLVQRRLQDLVTPDSIQFCAIDGRSVVEQPTIPGSIKAAGPACEHAGNVKADSCI